MGYGDDVVAFVHDGPSNGMAITIFGSMKSKHKMNRIPSRIPISVINPYHYESERDIVIRQSEHPMRKKDREIFSQNIDARYFDIKNRIKSAYSCNQEICPILRQRLERHQLEKHSSLYGYNERYGIYRRQDAGKQNDTSSTIPQRTATKSGPDLLESHTVQTNNNNIVMGDSQEMRDIQYEHNSYRKLNDNNQHNFKLVETTDPNINTKDDHNIPLARTETRELIAPKRNIYKDYAQKEIREWFEDIPFHPIFENREFNKEDHINNLSDKIEYLLTEYNTNEYNHKLLDTIDSFLNSTPMWVSGTKFDKDYFKKSLNNKLFNRILNLNEKMSVKDRLNSSKTYDNSQINGESSKSHKHLPSDYDAIKEEINNWLLMIKFKQNRHSPMSVDKKGIAEILIKRKTQLLNQHRHTSNYKLSIKATIVDVLNDLPIGAKLSRDNIYINRFAEDLTNRILSIHAKTKQKHKSLKSQPASNQMIYNFDLNKTRHECINMIYNEITKCLEDTRFAESKKVKAEITNILADYADSSVSVEDNNVQTDILNVLKRASNVPDLQASKIVECIIKAVKKAANQANNKDVSSIKSKLSENISVYTFENPCCSRDYPVTSTPKKKKIEKSIDKLSPEEIEYAEKVGELIRAWMQTLPEQFDAPDERAFKDIIIKDLAGEITDLAQLEQLATVDEKEKWRKYLIYKWLLKLDVFDLEEVGPQIEDLRKKLNYIPIPNLTRPHCGNRQAMANIKHVDSESGWEEYFVPKGKDILEDEISIWMNKQPAEMFDADRSTRGNKIHELAVVLQNKLNNKRPGNEISNDVAQWLNVMVKPEQRMHVGELADDLKSKVINLPQDITLAAIRDRKNQEKAEYMEAKKKLAPIISPKTSNIDTLNTDKTMQQFIAKFIEHNYDIDDPMARGAFSHLLKTKLQRLNPPTRKEVYDNFAKSDHLSRNKLIKELEYIKDVSDWLKIIPIETSYNTVGNRQRIDFVNNLARNILAVEEQREADPEAMDYNTYMASIINQFLIQLPIIPEHKNDKYMMYMIDQLVGKVIVHRSKVKNISDSIDTSGVHDENIGDFIEEFIRVNGGKIADDEVKLDAWSARLLTEVKSMIREDGDPTALSKAKVYNRLTTVPLPKDADETVKQFEKEFEYIKEITEWLKNLPLLPLDKAGEEKRIYMICGLAEKITLRNMKKSKNPNDTAADTEFADYVSKWISELSLEEDHEVKVDIVIQQLLNRVVREKTRQDKPYIETTSNIKISKKPSNKSIKSTKIKHMKNPAGAIVDAIEKWSASLPIKADDEKFGKSIKDNAAKKLYQTVGELSIDPRTFNDDLLYQEILTDEVDAVLENLPQSPELQKNKEKLKSEIVEQVTEAQKSLKENCAGEFYKQKLEHTIEASIPHPVKARQAYDPGFEIYKSRLADMFILENFDHANDAVKIKYERRIKDEIDNYYDSAKNRNAIPLTKDEIYNELYSALFKVPIPNESSVIGEVEEIKTRCEVDVWFDKLPLKETNSLIELFEREQMLATLAKRIHEIEKAESKPDSKIRKEIMKWLSKLSIQSDYERNLEDYAKKLQDILKSSSDKRKCFLTDTKSKKGKTKFEPKHKIKRQRDDSQVPGPSTEGQMWESQVTHAGPKKKAAEIILEIVEDWCNQIPIRAITKQEDDEAKMMKDTLSTKIIIKISELMNPKTFMDDFYFDSLLDEELDEILSGLPTCCNFEQSKAAKKTQLINAVKSVKPLLREEKAKHQYRQNLNKTVASVLDKPQDITADKEALFTDLRDEIVEYFIQYNYDKNDDECRQEYKIKVQDAILKFLNNVAESKDETIDVLKRRNQLLCELAKIPISGGDLLKEEVEEIRMKNDITEFFDHLSISDNDKNRPVNHVKSSLAKKLNDIELFGHSPENDEKMKQEIEKSLKKLNKGVKPEVIHNFVNKLKDDEIDRRAPPNDKNDIEENTTCQNNCKMRKTCNQNALQVNKRPTNDNQRQKPINTRHKEIEINQKFQPSNICECPKEKFVQKEVSTENLDIDNDQETCIKLCRDHIEFQRIRNSEESLEGQSEREDDRCYCGMRKSRHPCYMPTRWYCNSPSDMPFCRIPAFFYY